MDDLYIILVAVVFAFILFNIINNKRLSIFSLFLFIIMTIFYCIKKFDQEYYESLVKGIDNIDLYAVIVASSSLVISIIEYIVGGALHKKKLANNTKIKKNKHNKKVSEEVELVNFNEVKENPNNDNDLLVYLELMNEPIACLLKDNYLINNKMKRLLNVDNYQISREQFQTFILKEDKKNYNEENKINNFRLNIGDSEAWYEESKANLKGSVYKLVRLSSNIKGNKVNLHTFKELSNLLINLKRESKNFYLVFFDLMNTSDISGFYGQDFTDMIINRYLKEISNLPYISKLNLFYISKTEYVILFDDETEYNIMLSELDNQTSVLLRQEIKVSNIKVILKSRVGLIDSTRVKDNTIQNIIKKGFETLKLASSVNYKGDYAIYNPVDDDIDYSARDLNIDLNFDLEQYKKRLK